RRASSADGAADTAVLGVAVQVDALVGASLLPSRALPGARARRGGRARRAAGGRAAPGAGAARGSLATSARGGDEGQRGEGEDREGGGKGSAHGPAYDGRRSRGTAPLSRSSAILAAFLARGGPCHEPIAARARAPAHDDVLRLLLDVGHRPF